MFVLVVTHEEDFGMPPSVYGPFTKEQEAVRFAEKFRERNNLPREATPENNDIWTDRGWYFGIVTVGKKL